MALVRGADNVWREGGDLSSIDQCGEMSVQDLIDEFGYLPQADLMLRDDHTDIRPSKPSAVRVKRYNRWSEI